jgi:hypothetical protein
MKAFNLLAIIVTLPILSFGKSSADDIDELVTRLSANHGMWINGTYPALELPKATSTNEVIGKVFQMISFDDGRVTKYKVLAERHVQIPPMQEIYTAISIQSNIGPMVALVRYDGHDWWSRVFDHKHWPFHGN